MVTFVVGIYKSRFGLEAVGSERLGLMLCLEGITSLVRGGQGIAY